MKTKLAIVAIVLSMASFVDADPGFGIALKGGPNAATTSEDSSLDVSSRYGLSSGLAGYLQWPLGERYSLGAQLELLYVPRGLEMSFEDALVAKIREHYLDIAIVARPGTRLGPVGVYVLLGGGLNLLMSATSENASGMERDITGDLHRVDVSLLAGLGGALNLPHRTLGPFRLNAVFLEARHDHGLLDTDAVNGGFKNRASSLMLGLSLALSSE